MLFFPPTFPPLRGYTAVQCASIVIASPRLLPEPYMCPSAFHALARPRSIPLRCPTCQARQIPTIVLGRSRINRFGIFASGTVHKGEMLIGCAGEWVPRSTVEDDEECLRHPDDVNKAWRSFQPDWLAFINHSSIPNCAVVIGVDDMPSLRVSARRIQPWTELTIDYGEHYSPNVDD